MNKTLTPQSNAQAYRRAGQKRKSSRNEQILSYLSLLFFPAFLFLCEFMLKISLFGTIGAKQLFYIFAFSMSFGLLVTLFIRAFACGVAALAENKDVIRPLTAILIGIVSFFALILFLVQFVYFRYFGSFFQWSTIGMATDVTDYYREILQVIGRGWYWVLLFIVPVVLYILFPAKKMPTEHIKPVGAVVMLAAALICHFGAEAVIYADDDEYRDKTYYTQIFDAPYAVRNFGMIANTKLDFTQLIFGSLSGKEIEIDPDLPSNFNPLPDVEIKDPNLGGIIGGDSLPPSNPEIEYGYNIMEIDFDSLIASEKNSTIKSMHEYFSQEQLATKQNRFTGYFKGKNLIFITLEGFSHKVIDPTLTPTLYKMSTNGFVFNNFYNSTWGGSTATGEYALLTGNFYKRATCIEESSKTYQPFALGNMFSPLGYKTTAYHNHTYTYYQRHLSHPNFGYEWKAIGNGLVLPSKKWPNSDHEMSQVTGPEYINQDKPFMTYYMTVSGHALYNRYNSMSRKHEDRVAHLNYSEQVKWYIACQLEVEDMLTDLMAQLQAAGKLDDTVFVISEDHYPYALAWDDDSKPNNPQSLAELYGLPNDENLYQNFELYRNFLSIYCTSMKEPVIVNEPCSTIDVLPTVLNLFGLEYDSRLITGTDILDESTPNLVILNCDQSGSAWNWITRYGSYSTKTKEFTPADGISFDSADAEAAYINSMNTMVKLKRQYSYLILEKDYYSYLKKYIG